MRPADGAELLESLDRHFMAGCESLSTRQLRAHLASGVCRECTARALAAVDEARERNVGAS